MQQPVPMKADNQGDLPEVPRAIYGVWTGQSVSVFGSMLTSLSLVLWLQQKGATPALISLYFMAGSITSLVAGLFSGPIADRYEKRRLVLVGDILAAASVASLALLYFFGQMELVPMVACIIFLRCTIIVAASFRGPALSTYVAAVVHKGRFRKFNSLFTASRQVSGAVGEASGATMFSILGAGALFGLDLFSYAVAILASIFFMEPNIGSTQKEAPAKTSKLKILVQDIQEGLRYIKTNHQLSMLVALALTMNFFYAPVIAWIPFRIADAVPQQLGWLGYTNAALTVGMIFGSLLSGYLSFLKGRELLAIKGASILVGVVLVGYGVMSGQIASLILSMALGLSVGFFNVLATSHIVEVADPQMRGRVLAFVSTLGQVVSPLSIGVGGWIADKSPPGLGILFVGSGIGMIVGATIFILNRKRGGSDGTESIGT